MKVTAKISVVLLAAAMLACGMLSGALSFNPTTTASTKANYDALRRPPRSAGGKSTAAAQASTTCPCIRPRARASISTKT